MKNNKIYTIVVVAVFAAYALVFATFGRSTYSELEKRELRQFPDFSWTGLADGSYAAGISSWFSDTEPFRDVFMTQSMKIKRAFRLSVSDDDVVIHASSNRMTADDDAISADSLAKMAAADSLAAFNNAILEGNAQIANNGIIITGKGKNVRALMAFGGTAKSGNAYAAAINKYKETFGTDVNVYCMLVPTSTEFYCPKKARSATRMQKPTIDNIHSLLSPDVKVVDVHQALAAHVAEDIYLRTDHHWAPLGGYYAAGELARVAGVPFRKLDAYEADTVRRFVGTMYGYSKDISVKEAPEDFIFHKPKDIEYTTTYTDYQVDSLFRIVGQTAPQRGLYFYPQKDGSGTAYSMFMGSDMRLTQVRTATKNGRRLLVLKDSFGNAVPGYLFFSFEEIHVVDYRYFSYNLRDYAHKNGITDIVFINNVFPVCSGYTAQRYLRFLTQKTGIVAPETSAVKDSTATAVTDSFSTSDKKASVAEQNAPFCAPTDATLQGKTPSVAEQAAEGEKTVGKEAVADSVKNQESNN